MENALLQNHKIISVLLVLFLCAASFAGGAVFGKKYGYENAHYQGYLAGKMDLFYAVTQATGYKESDGTECKHLTDFKADALYVCTINDVKTIAVSD